MPRYVPISSGLSWNIDGLLEAIWADLGLVRVYTKPKGEIPDLDEPVILKGMLHEQKYGRVCGKAFSV